MSGDETESQIKLGDISFSDWKRIKKKLNPENTAIIDSPKCSKQIFTTNGVSNPYNKICNQNNFKNFSDIMPGWLHPWCNFMNNTHFMMPACGIPQHPYHKKDYQNKTYNRLLNYFPRYEAMTKASGTKATEQQPEKPRIEPVAEATKSQDEKSEKTSLGNTHEVLKPTQGIRRRWYDRPHMPPKMIVLTNESKEEKQRLWREYRQKMKPFKNREFHNAKRVIQRLGKKNFEELEEKERERLKRAKEQVAAHKAMLNEKATKRWVSESFAASNVKPPIGFGYDVSESKQPSTGYIMSSNNTNTCCASESNQTSPSDKLNANRREL